jgi:Mn2+/Fe2+ NRAMP family transporter
MKTKSERMRRFLLFLAIMGPGIITANVDNDAGGITTYSLAGTNWGYQMLYAFIPITLVLIVVQEMVARMGVVTGRGLADLIRENYGVKVTFYVLVTILVTNVGNIIAEFAGVAASMEIFGVSKYISVPAACFIVWWLVIKGTYKLVERVFLVACVFYVAYIVSGMMVHAPLGEIARGFVRPRLEFSPAYTAMLIGLVGTTIAPWMQFYLQASIVDKGVKLDSYGYVKADVISGCIAVNVVAVFIVITCAATLHAAGVTIVDAKDAALALKPLAGEYCSHLFAFGLLNASLFAAAILPLSTAYTICEGMGWETGVDRKFFEAPQFYWLYTGLIAIGGLIILIPNFPLIKIMYVSQVVNGVALPVVLVLMLRLINKKEIMGEYVNSKMYNAISWTTVVVMSALSIYMVAGSLFMNGV